VLLVDCDLRRPCQQKLFNLSSAVGYTNLVVSGETNRNAAAQAVYHLAAAKANLLGAILNKVDQRREGYHSYYYHQQYYRSYYTEETLDAGNGTGMLAGAGPKSGSKPEAGKRGKGSDEG
jgi:Mrp family chromosome partitioning ATPase